MATGFDFDAINVHMAKQLVKDLLKAFDADGNRNRLAKALVEANERTDAVMMIVTPLALDIAAEALVKWGITNDEGAGFVQVMRRVALLGPQDEALAFDVYQLKQKFLPVVPPEVLEAEALRIKEELQKDRRAAQAAYEACVEAATPRNKLPSYMR